MMQSRYLGAISAVVFIYISISANAALHGRLPATTGGTDYQAAYDDVLDITWVTNAALSGINTWDDQVDWASNLNYLGFTDWRLASMSVSAPVGSLPDTTVTTSVVNCSSATELACRDNELEYMFYHNMGGSFLDDKRGDQTIGDVTLTGVKTVYWSGTEFNSSNAWYFIFSIGLQGNYDKSFSNYGWAVRAGDVSAVPYIGDGDLAPLNDPDGAINAGDVLVAARITFGLVTAGELQLAHGDVYPPGNPDGVINLQDLILITQMAL